MATKSITAADQNAADDLTELNARIADEAAKATTADARAKARTATAKD